MVTDMAPSPFLIPFFAAVMARLIAICLRRAAALLRTRLWWLANVFAFTAGAFLLLSFYWALALDPQRLPGETSAVVQIGKLIVMAGTLLALFGLLELGPGAILVKPGSPLITGGVYARMRRPMDAGVLLIGVGAALAQGNADARLWILLWIPLSLALSELEEWELRGRSSEARAYFKHTPRYFPWRGRR